MSTTDRRSVSPGLPSSVEADQPPPPARSGLLIGALILLPLVSLALALVATADNSPTVDEFAHLPAGVYYWRTGDFSLYDLNPPLAKLIAAAPVMAMSPALSVTTRAVQRENVGPWWVGAVFLYENQKEYDGILFLGRIPIALCGAVLVGVVCFWSWRLFGWAAGLVSGAAAALSPNLLAHSGLVTPDIPLTLFWLLTLFFLWKTFCRPRWYWTAACGVCLAAAILTKYNALILPCAIPVAALLAGFLKREEKAGEDKAAGLWDRRPFVHSLVAIILALLLVGVLYGFEGLFRQPGTDTKSSTLRKFSWVPVPLPAPYVKGLDKQLVNVERGEWGSYLNGRTYRGGCWYYFPEAFLLKVPTPTLLLGVLALLAGRRLLRRPGPALVALAVPAAAFLAVNMFLGGLNIGLRYILPVFPVFFIGLGVFAMHGRWFRTRAAVAGTLLLALAVVVVANCPCYISYFNRIAGGREGGPRYLLDSNVDWGQDLKRLTGFLRSRQIDTVKLIYFGGYIPKKQYGINFDLDRVTPESRGWVAISVHYLYGMPYADIGAREYVWLKQYTPAAIIGGSIYVYHLDGQGP
jgi:hypothetical protein